MVLAFSTDPQKKKSRFVFDARGSPSMNRIKPGKLVVLGVAIVLVATLGSRFTKADQPAVSMRSLGCLDVTQPPYLADRTGQADATKALQQAIDDARDAGLACFFPEGTYLISDTLSCEQQVAKLDRPRFTDRKTQHYWDKTHRIVMIGSTKGKRPVLKLAPDAPGFDDQARPKLAVWIWAQLATMRLGKKSRPGAWNSPTFLFTIFSRGSTLISVVIQAPLESAIPDHRGRPYRTARSRRKVPTPGLATAAGRAAEPIM